MLARISGRLLSVSDCILAVQGLVSDDAVVALRWAQTGGAHAKGAATSSIIKKEKGDKLVKFWYL